MKLSKFISSTLTEIVEGIELANEQLSNKNVRVNPPNISWKIPQINKFWGCGTKTHYQNTHWLKLLNLM